MGIVKIRQSSFVTPPWREKIRLTSALCTPVSRRVAIYPVWGKSQSAPCVSHAQVHLKSSRPKNPMNTQKRIEQPGFTALKEKYLQCFGVRASNMQAWQETVRSLNDRGISRELLVDWAVGAGYSRSYVSSLLSRIFCSLGLRKRGIGAGRKPSPDALELLAHARDRFGERFLKVLRAAWRAGKTQSAAALATESPSRSAIDIVVAPQLGHNSKVSGKRFNTPGTRSKHDRQSLATIFKTNVNTVKKAGNQTRAI